jgi:hypothetical protein
MSLNTAPGNDAACAKAPPTRREILPAPVANQNRSGPWYSIAVMSSAVFDGISDQVAA